MKNSGSSRRSAPRPNVSLKEIQKERSRRSLKYFIQGAWHVLEPLKRPFVDNWHIDAICDHLQAVTDGDILRLLINIPPGHMKSLAVSVFWPAWEWGPRGMPETRWLFASYAQALSTRDTVKCRRLIDSPWYQEHWGDRFNFAHDQNTKTRYENDKTGYRIATSVGGVATGERGDRVVVDDPHHVKEAESEIIREGAIDWWNETMSTRTMDAEESAMVVIMQRVHERDLSGDILEQGGYEHLCLPAEFEPERKCLTSIGFEDPRTEDEELLYPQRFGPEWLKDIKRRLGSYATAAQLQQSPAPREGGIVKKDWLKYYGRPPANFIRIVQSWDTAFKPAQHNDPSVCLTWGETETGYYLLHVWRERVEYPDLLRAARSLGEKYSPQAILIEDAASGQSLIQDIKRKTSLPIIPIMPESDKLTRMSSASPNIEAGLLHLPESAPWLMEYVGELTTFPMAAHDDQVDATSQFLRWITARTERKMIKVMGF